MKTTKRFGAFLRLYGPRGAHTHAKLVLTHEPRPNTPEAFYDEIDTERRIDGLARSACFAIEFRPHITSNKR